jgi:hypothetical protein
MNLRQIKLMSLLRMCCFCLFDIRPDTNPVTSNDRSIDLIFQLTMRGEVDAGQ